MDNNKVFSLKFDVNSAKKTYQYVRLVVSTQYLLELTSRNSSFGCVDATYQLVYKGHSIIMSGHVDKHRQFLPTCLALSTNENNKDYSFVLSSINVNFLTPNFLYSN
jgi:hypothetical protein